MSGLGLALAAANGYFKEDDAAQQRDREAKRFEWDTRRNEAELGLLPSRIEAQRSGYDLLAKKNTADLDLVDPRAALEQQRLAGEAEVLPYQQSTNLSNARSGKLLAQENEEQTPNRIDAARRQAHMDEQAAFAKTLSGLKDHLMNDTTGRAAVEYLNQTLPTFSATKGRNPVAKITLAIPPGMKERHLLATDASGEVVLALPESRVQALAASATPVKYEKMNAGDSLVQIRNGQATNLFTAPESKSSKEAKMGPLERDVAYLESAHGMTKPQALAHMNSAKTMTRDQFVIKSVQDMQALNKEATPEEVAKIGALYDSIVARSGTPSTAGKGLPPPATAGTTTQWQAWAK